MRRAKRQCYPSDMESKILAFYRGTGCDHAGRTLEEILAWQDSALEFTHDYIQWLFPLPEPSAFNPWAPVLAPSDIAAFRDSQELQHQLRRAAARMKIFYQLDRERPSWITPHNHNFLRLSRILASLRLLGLEDEAADWFAKLSELYSRHAQVIGAETWRYWQAAAQRTG